MHSLSTPLGQVFIEQYWRVPGMKTLLIQALMAHNAVRQGACFEYWAERRAYRDGIRLRGDFERLGYRGALRNGCGRGRIDALVS